MASPAFLKDKSFQPARPTRAAGLAIATQPASLIGASEAELTARPAACEHCGDSLFGLKIVRRRIGGANGSYCCLGCAFIAEQLFLATADGWPLAPPELARAPPAMEDGVTPAATVSAQWLIEGMVCGACALLLTARLSRSPGVQAAQVDFSTRRAAVVFDPTVTSPQRLIERVARAGYAMRSLDAPSTDTPRRKRIALLRVLAAWLIMMQVMMLAGPAYLAAPGDIAPDIEQLLRVAQLVLMVPMVLFCATPLLRAAASQLRTATVAMDLPIVVGLAAAFGASVWAIVAASGPVYFDSVSMFVALVLAVRAWQSHALSAAAGHVTRVTDHATLQALRLLGWPVRSETETVAAEHVAIGEHVLVPAGSRVPVDGTGSRAGSGSVASQFSRLFDPARL